MKKLIAIAVVFALVAGVAFAVDLGGTAIGTANVLEGDTVKDSKITSSGNLNRVRIDGSGEVADGAFGGYFRYDNGGFAGNAWWKPIDQFRLLVGSNGGDGFYGKEGVTGWMFQQTVYDTGVGFGSGNIWGGGYGSTLYRNAFYGGDGGGDALRLEITPMDILAINLNLPVFNGGEVADVFMQAVAQVDLKFDFGNIALTYRGGKGYKEEVAPTAKWNPKKVTNTDASKVKYEAGWDLWDKTAGDWLSSGTASSSVDVRWNDKLKEKDENQIDDPSGAGKWDLDGGDSGYDDPGKIFLYYGGSFDALSIDFSFGYEFASHYTDRTNLPAGKKIGDEKANPISIGLGVKYASDAFGIKFRTVASLAGDDKQTAVLAEVLPYFILGDNLAAFVSAGLALTMPEKGDAVTGWHFNPYIQVGEEWGAKFLAGLYVWSDGKKGNDGKDDPVIKWGVPLALIVSF